MTETYPENAPYDVKLLEEIRCLRCVNERILRVMDEGLFVDYQMEKFGKNMPKTVEKPVIEPKNESRKDGQKHRFRCETCDNKKEIRTNDKGIRPFPDEEPTLMLGYKCKFTGLWCDDKYDHTKQISVVGCASHSKPDIGKEGGSDGKS